MSIQPRSVRRAASIPLAAFACLALVPARAGAQTSPIWADGGDRIAFVDAPLREVIRAIERGTDWHFLYRDSMISGRRVTFESTLEEAVPALDRALRVHGMGLTVDAPRRQVLLHAADDPVQTAVTPVTGRVVDAETGAPLPFATAAWLEGSSLRGVVTDAAGRFDIRPSDRSVPVVLLVSYVGFEPRSVSVPPQVSEIAVRLTPRPLTGSEVVVTGTMLTTEVDTSLHHLLRPGIMSALGESGAIRSLQALPSVSIGTGFSDGLTVRGNQADGFQVLLDGMPVYSQSHLFGLFDAFNDDALQAVGLFYGIAPPSYQAPPGGTVSFVTRSGSTRSAGGSVGLSNTSARGTVEGPLGSGSWLVSGRRSYLAGLDWLGSDLVAMGLDLARPASAPAAGAGRLRLDGEADALYFDGHLRADLEGRSGRRLTVSAYMGGDRAQYAATRLVQVMAAGGGPSGMRSVDAGTMSRWGTGSASALARIPLQVGGVSVTQFGFTRYHAGYRKEDFAYAGRPDSMHAVPRGGPPVARLGRFSDYSNLNQARLSQDFSIAGAGGSSWTMGAVVDLFDMHLEEESLDRVPFILDRSAAQVDAFAGVSTPRGGPLGIDVGARVHYWGLGPRLGFSPRIALRAAENRKVSASLGYSRNHQFLHRISLEHQGYADLWVLSGPDEEPTVVDYVTGGINAHPTGGVFVQAEIYVKDYRHVRLHETVAEARGFVAEGLLGRPWLADADGRAWGFEAMVRHAVGRVVFSHGYTWSVSELSHPMLQGGAPFPAPWDRRHQYRLFGRADLGQGISVSAAWMIASGLPNSLRLAAPAEEERLPVYHRLDATLDWSIAIRPGRLALRLGVFNAYDRQNTWYRALLPVVMASDRSGRLVEASAVDVYDLGLQPSLEVRYTF